ncbi:MAG: hypothetical protein MUQ00_13700 [Candidatus Aminicenantes bacterium]|nr:hypothetical protein [Candidatus Aminicenantes bacterium]
MIVGGKGVDNQVVCLGHFGAEKDIGKIGRELFDEFFRHVIENERDVGDLELAP